MRLAFTSAGRPTVYTVWMPAFFGFGACFSWLPLAVTADRFCDCGGSYVAFVVLHTVLGHFGCTICSMGVSDIFCDNTIFTFIQFNADTLGLVRRYMLRKMPDLPTLSSSYQ